VFCSHCGSPCAERIPEGDDRLRAVCEGCGSIHYQNPRIVVGAMVLHEGSLLICRRAIEPREGFWTCPGGFMECGESMAQAAARETWEEARARVRIMAPLATLDLPHIHQVHAFFRAELTEPGAAPGPESHEIAWLPLGEVLQREWAFPVMEKALEWWTADPEGTSFHQGRLDWNGVGPRYALDSYDLGEHWCSP
jgi:ADP-ribose pyrophosphatase YjhB (NUDIX family)